MIKDMYVRIEFIIRQICSKFNFKYTYVYMCANVHFSKTKTIFSIKVKWYEYAASSLT